MIIANLLKFLTMTSAELTSQQVPDSLTENEPQKMSVIIRPQPNAAPESA